MQSIYESTTASLGAPPDSVQDGAPTWDSPVAAALGSWFLTRPAMPPALRARRAAG